MKFQNVLLPVIMFSVLLLGISCTQTKSKKTSEVNTEEKQKVEKPVVITSKAVGQVTVGMSIDKFQKLVFDGKTVKEETMSMEGNKYTIYNIYKNGNLALTVEPSGDKIYRIWVYEKDLKTEKGIGIDDTLADILKLYKVKNFSAEEENIAIQVESYDYIFILDRNGVPEDWWLNPKFETLKENIKIEKIMVI